MRKRFMGMNARQQAVFDQIAVGGNPFAHRAILKGLEAKGLVVGRDVQTFGPTNHPLDRFPLTVREYAVPLGIHIQWCAWCSEQIAAGATP